MIDIRRERLISLKEAATLLPSCRQGRPTHVSKLLRLVLNGQTSSDGMKVRLEAVKAGGSWATSVEALQRFFEATTPRPNEQLPTSGGAITSSASRSRGNTDRVARELDHIGI